METQENATQNAIAAPEGSAPQENTEVASENAEGQGSAPEETPSQTEQNTEVEGAEPSKAVKELIAQRKKRQQAEQEAAYWKGVAEGRGTKQEPTIQVPVKQELPSRPPHQDNFETFEEYEEARASYVLNKAKEEIRRELVENQRIQQENQLVRTFQERMEAAAKDDPTIIDIQNDTTLHISDAMAFVIKQSEEAPHILKWLDQNRDESKRISSLHPIMAAKELGKIEDSIKKKPTPKPPPKVSAAPEPIKTVTPSGSPSTDEDKLPLDEWIRRRNEAQFKRR